VGGKVHLLERLFLGLQLLLRQVGHRHVARVDGEARLGRLFRRVDVVVGSTAVPDNEVAGLHAHLLPLAASVRKPLQSSLGEAVPFLGPSPNLGLVDELLVELLREEVCALADDESAVLGSVGEKVDETLKAAEAGLERILVLG